jgi:hypothetical protein
MPAAMYHQPRFRFTVIVVWGELAVVPAPSNRKYREPVRLS